MDASDHNDHKRQFATGHDAENKGNKCFATKLTYTEYYSGDQTTCMNTMNTKALIASL